MLQERTSSILTRRTVQLFSSAGRFGFIRRFYERHKVATWISVATLLFLIVYLAPATVIFVGAGKAGVIYERFGRGTRTDVTYSEGTHVIWPWDTMTIYDVRIHETTTQFTIISANGLDIAMTLSIRFYPRMKSLGLLHQQAGPDYAEKIIVPEIQAIVRNLSANYEPQEIYRTEAVLDQSIRAEASRRLEERFIALDAILIEQIEFPASVQTAIESKLVAKEAAEEMKFKIEKEGGEKQRKLVEAEGIRLFNSTIQASLSDEVLKYKEIEALLEMAKSAKSNSLFFGAPHSFRYLLGPGLDTATKGPAALGSAVSP
jgi:regulator of protease activity HflC (stomatin/prohibitin superfamily)